jgi:hypothetical protein
MHRHTCLAMFRFCLASSLNAYPRSKSMTTDYLFWHQRAAQCSDAIRRSSYESVVCLVRSVHAMVPLPVSRGALDQHQSGCNIQRAGTLLHYSDRESLSC